MKKKSYILQSIRNSLREKNKESEELKKLSALNFLYRPRFSSEDYTFQNRRIETLWPSRQIDLVVLKAFTGLVNKSNFDIMQFTFL